jgi:hypothetical protein
MEAYIRKICQAAFQSGETQFDKSKQIQLHVVKVIKYSSWAPMERARMIAMCAALKDAHDTETVKMATEQERLEGEMRDNKRNMEEVNEDIKANEAVLQETAEELAAIETKFGQDNMQKWFHWQKAADLLKEANQRTEALNKKKDQENKTNQNERGKIHKMIAKASEQIRGLLVPGTKEYTGLFGKESLNAAGKKGEALSSPTSVVSWNALLKTCQSELGEMRKKIEKATPEELKIYQRLKSDMERGQKANRRIKKSTASFKRKYREAQKKLEELSSTDHVQLDLQKKYGITAEVGAFVEACMARLFPPAAADQKNPPLADMGKRLMGVIQNKDNIPDMFKSKLELEDLESCVRWFYDERVAMMRQLEHALQNNLEQARLARQLKRMDATIIQQLKQNEQGRQQKKQQGLLAGRSSDKVIDLMWFNSFLADTPVGVVKEGDSNNNGNRGAVNMAVSQVGPFLFLKVVLKVAQWSEASLD